MTTPKRSILKVGRPNEGFHGIELWEDEKRVSVLWYTDEGQRDTAYAFFCENLEEVFAQATLMEIAVDKEGLSLEDVQSHILTPKPPPVPRVITDPNELNFFEMLQLGRYGTDMLQGYHQQTASFEHKILAHCVPFMEHTKTVPTFESVSIRTDGSGYPMFPEEIRDMVNGWREQYKYPEFTAHVTLRMPDRPDTILTECLTLSELLRLGFYLEEKHEWAGAYMMGFKPTEGGW